MKIKKQKERELLQRWKLGHKTGKGARDELTKKVQMKKKQKKKRRKY